MSFARSGWLGTTAALVWVLAAGTAHAQVPPAWPGRQLTIASWNLEFLALRDGEGCRPRTEADYAALRQMVAAIDADVIAFQEVENYAAAERVFDRRRYRLIMERRPGANGGTCRGAPAGQQLIPQAVGFAVRRGLHFSARELTALRLGDPNLRSGLEVGLRVRGGRHLRLLGVHLKSGCAGGGTSESCATLGRQVQVLERWIDEAARAPYRFVVVGDWNRRLASVGDTVWAALDDGNPPNADLSLAAGGAMPRCDPLHTSFIDHFALDRRATASLVSFQEVTFAGPRLSDHCPVVMRITL